jgi:opacity protein-like surface antigen
MFKAGGGFTQPVRYTDGRLNTGFNIGAGVGVNFVPWLGIMGEFGFNDLNLSSTALSAAGVPGGSTRIYSVTANPVVRFNPRGRFDAYLTGGGGFYRRTVEFTEPSVGTVTAFDPFYGAFYPVNVPVTNVLGSISQNKGGLNAGGGVSFRIRGDSNTKFFAEARYHHLFTTPVRTTILPVTFGFSW